MEKSIHLLLFALCRSYSFLLFGIPEEQRKQRDAYKTKEQISMLSDSRGKARTTTNGLNSPQQLSIGWIGMFIVIVILIGLAILIIKYINARISAKKNAKEVIKDRNIKHILDDIYMSIRQLKTLIDKINTNSSLTDKEINDIVDRVIKRIHSKKPDDEIKEIEPPTEKEPTYKYLLGWKDNIFSRVESSPNTDTFYRLFNEKDNSADFEFYGDEKQAIAMRIPSHEIVFKIIEGTMHNASKIENVEPGELKKVDRGWEIIKPIHIKLS